MFAMLGWAVALIIVAWFGVIAPLLIGFFGAVWSGRWFENNYQRVGFFVWEAVGLYLTYSVWVEKPFTVLVEVTQ